MKTSRRNALLTRIKITRCNTTIMPLTTVYGKYLMALSIAILASVGCSRAGATRAHVPAMKPAPKSVQPDPGAPRNSDTERVTPKVWELTALAARKGPSVA
jgi:hypothetical protein